MDCREKVETGGIRHGWRGSEDTSPKVGQGLQKALGSGSPTLRFLIFYELGDAHQVIGQHRCAHQHLEPFTALSPATLHPATAKEDRNASLDADPESLSLLERGAPLQGFLLRSLLSAPLRDAHLGYLGLLTTLHIGGAVKTAISGVPLGRVLEGFLMTLQRTFHMVGVGGIPLQHPVVGDQALSTLSQENLVAEFHRLLSLAPLDPIRVGLEERVDLLLAGNLFSL